MDYREIIESNDSVIIKGVKNFNIKQILECGQCFRWQRVTDTDYIVVSNRRVIEIIQEDDEVIIHNTNMNDFKNIWENYFDLNNNMEVAREDLTEEQTVSEMEDIIYPMYIPKNTSLESQDKVEKEVGERVILTFAGESPFVFIQETSPVSEEMSVLPVDGEPILLASGIGALTDSSITWIEDNIEYYITTTDLTEEEMLEVVNSVSVMPIGK